MKRRFAVSLPIGEPGGVPLTFAEINVYAETVGHAYAVARLQAIALAHFLLEWVEAPDDLFQTAEGAEPYRRWKAQE